MGWGRGRLKLGPFSPDPLHPLKIREEVLGLWGISSQDKGPKGPIFQTCKCGVRACMILDMETERPSNTGGLHLEADIGASRIYEPPPPCHQLYKICHVYVYMSHFSNLAASTLGAGNSLLGVILYIVRCLVVSPASTH